MTVDQLMDFFTKMKTTCNKSLPNWLDIAHDVVLCRELEGEIIGKCECNIGRTCKIHYPCGSVVIVGRDDGNSEAQKVMPKNSVFN